MLAVFGMSPPGKVQRVECRIGKVHLVLLRSVCRRLAKMPRTIFLYFYRLASGASGVNLAVARMPRLNRGQSVRGWTYRRQAAAGLQKRAFHQLPAFENVIDEMRNTAKIGIKVPLSLKEATESGYRDPELLHFWRCTCSKTPAYRRYSWRSRAIHLA